MNEPANEPRDEAARRRRVRDVFGDVLPDTTRDERGNESDDGDRDAWYRDNRPPHHDRG